MPLDELVGVREVERRVSGHQLGELGQHLGILVHPRRKLGPLLRLHAVRTRRERLHLSDRGEELGGLVVLVRRRGPRSDGGGDGRAASGAFGSLSPWNGLLNGFCFFRCRGSGRRARSSR